MKLKRTYLRVKMHIKDTENPRRSFYRFQIMFDGIGTMSMDVTKIPNKAVVECGYFKKVKHLVRLSCGCQTEWKWIKTATKTGKEVKASHYSFYAMYTTSESA
jgi:hypothetical protein